MSGDYDVRGMDPETLLVGPVSEPIIDADRRVRRRLNNGFPNWAMYRTAYAGDSGRVVVGKAQRATHVSTRAIAKESGSN